MCPAAGPVEPEGGPWQLTQRQARAPAPNRDVKCWGRSWSWRAIGWRAPSAAIRSSRWGPRCTRPPAPTASRPRSWKPRRRWPASSSWCPSSRRSSSAPPGCCRPTAPRCSSSTASTASCGARSPRGWRRRRSASRSARAWPATWRTPARRSTSPTSTSTPSSTPSSTRTAAIAPAACSALPSATRAMTSSGSSPSSTRSRGRSTPTTWRPCTAWGPSWRWPSRTRCSTSR